MDGIDPAKDVQLDIVPGSSTRSIIARSIIAVRIADSFKLDTRWPYISIYMKTILCTVLFAIGLTAAVAIGGISSDMDPAQSEVSAQVSDVATSTAVAAEQCTAETTVASLSVDGLTNASQEAAAIPCSACFERSPCPIQCHIQCGGCQ